MISRRTFATGALAAGGAVLLGTPVRADNPPLKVGLVMSYTGTPLYIGKGADAAIAAYQALHGDSVAGRKVVVIKRDDTGIAPDVARRMAQELVVQENVDVLIGGTSTPNALAIADVSSQAKKPYFVVIQGTTGFPSKHPYAVRFGFSTAQITEPLATWTAQSGAKTAYLMYQDYGPGIDAGAAFRRAFEAGGGTVVGESRVPITNQDYSAYIERVRDAKPQILYAFFNYIGGQAMLNAAFTSGLLRQTKVVSTDAIIPDSFVQAAARDIAVGLVSAQNYTYTHDSRVNRDFIAAFQRAYDPAAAATYEKTFGGRVLPEFGDVEAFDIMHAIYTIAKAQNGAFDPDRTIALVRGLHFESPRGPVYIDAQTRDIVQNVYIRRNELRAGRIAIQEIATIPLVRAPQS